MFNKEKIEQLQQDSFNKPIELFSQKEFAEAMLVRKNNIYSCDVEFKIGEDTVSTVDCETATDFLNKYADILEKNNIMPYSINPNFNTINLDNGMTIKTRGYSGIEEFMINNQQVLGKIDSKLREQVIDEASKLMNITTKVPDNNTIVTDNNTNIITLLNQMLQKKNEQQEDTEMMRGDLLLSTAGCDTIQSLYIKYNQIIFEEFEKNRENLLANDDVQATINQFDQLNITQSQEEITELREEFQQLINQANTLDFSNSITVNEWLEKLTKYINNSNLLLGPSTSDQIVELLEKNGYSNDKNEITNIQDFYKRILSYKIDDLKKYHIFATEYAEDLNLELSKNPDNAMLIEQELNDLYEKKKQLILNLETIDRYKKGLVDSNGRTNSSFEERIQELQKKLENPVEDKDKIKQASIVSMNNLKSFLYGKNSTDAENKAINSLYDTEVFPEDNNFIETLTLAASLPETSSVRNLIIDATTKLFARYSQNKNQEEQQAVIDVMNKLAITPFGEINIDTEAVKLEIEKIKQEQQSRIEREVPVIEKFKQQLATINSRILELETKKKNDRVKPALDSDKDDNDNFITKLSNIADEGPIFSDENRISQENSWMEVNTAKALNKYQNDDITPANEQTLPYNLEPEDKKAQILSDENRMSQENSWMGTNTAKDSNEYQNDDITPADEQTLPYVLKPEDKMPHVIKTIKEAPRLLLEKIRSVDYKAFVKKHIIPIIATALIAVVAITAHAKLKNNSDDYKSSLPNAQTVSDKEIFMTAKLPNEENTITNLPNNENTTTTVNPSKEEEKTSDDIWKTNLEIAQQDAINGDVYTNVYKAANREDAKPSFDASWETATPGAYYTMEEGQLEKLQEQEAKESLLNGDEIIVRYDNDGTPIGFVPVEHQENTSGMSK